MTVQANTEKYFRTALFACIAALAGCQTTNNSVPLAQLPSAAALEGVWQDVKWGDLITLRRQKGELVVASVTDSQSAEEFAVQASRWDGGTLSFRYRIPSNDTTVVSTIDQMEGDELAGRWRLEDNTNSGEFRYKKILEILPEVKEAAPKAGAAERVMGRVYRIRGNTIVIASGAMSNIHMHDRLYVKAGGQKIFLKVVFPMMTIARCALDRGSEQAIGKVAEGMTVYK